jgi:anthranilate/para-aminobenzoate synthase component II
MILLVDNYDSFTYNLAHYLAELGADVAVRRPEQLNGNLEPTHLVLSPGPGRRSSSSRSSATRACRRSASASVIRP